jgi:hypothetical protein
MAVVPGGPYSQLLQYHDGRATGQKDLVMSEWWAFTVTVVVTMLIGKFLSWGG